MKVIVIGAGVIGYNLSQSLTQEGHEVYLVEANPETARRVDEKLDVKVLTGSGIDPETLGAVDPQGSDLVIAVTASDETNLAVCSLASSMGAKRCIARVRNIALSHHIARAGRDKFSVDETINPEHLTSEMIVRTINTPGAKEVADFAQGQILLRSFEIPTSSPLCGLKVEALKEEHFPWPFLIVALIRNRQVIIPKGDTTIHPDDRIYALLPEPSLAEFVTFVNPEIRHPQKVIVYGATAIGEKVAEMLAPTISNVVLLEEDPVKAQAVAGRLSGVQVINGTGTEADILKESGIEAADAFIATSDNDHSNLISAVLAKRQGAKITIIVTSQPDYMGIVDALDIDVVINPRVLAADQIIRLVRGKGISAVTKLLECDTEALEFVPEEGSAVTKAPVKKIRFPKETIIGAVCDEKEVILVNGDTQIRAGQKVIVFCHENAVKKLQTLFTRKSY